MKFTTTLFILLISYISFAQNEKYKITIQQNGEAVKIKNNEAQINKTPFALVYKFTDPTDWDLIAGNSKELNSAFNLDSKTMTEKIHDADFGGADGYFNEDKSIRAWDGKIATGISYKDANHHTFDSIYKKGKCYYGVRTIEYLSTEDEALLVEEWRDSVLIIASASVEHTKEGKNTGNAFKLKLTLTEIPNSSPMDVKGKYYSEVGEAIPQEGCEGCGNLGYYNFSKNGKDIEFLGSGSDIIEMGTYIQEGNKVTIGEGKWQIVFTVSSDGNSMVYDKYGSIYKLKVQ